MSRHEGERALTALGFAKVSHKVLAHRPAADPEVLAADVEATKVKVRALLAKVRFRRRVQETIGR
jgi:hypothetical protein